MPGPVVLLSRVSAYLSLSHPEQTVPTVELTKDNFEQTVAGNDIVLVDFWAGWCGPCMRFAPVYEEAAEANPDVVFGKVDTEDQQELSASFQVMSIPTLMAFREQVLVFAQPGALPPAALDELLTKVRELDMDDVRRRIAEHEAQHAPQHSS